MNVYQCVFVLLSLLVLREGEGDVGYNVISFLSLNICLFYLTERQLEKSNVSY